MVSLQDPFDTRLALNDLHLAVHHSSDEVLVVDVALAVLVAHKELLGLLVAKLLPQGGQQVPELGGADEPIPIFVKVTKTLNKVITGISGPPGTDCLYEKKNIEPSELYYFRTHLHYRKELLESDPIVCPVFHHKLLNLALSGILNEFSIRQIDMVSKFLPVQELS